MLKAIGKIAKVSVKRIDKLLVSSFIAPFITTFCIALFVLIMIFFWTYIDDIVGKGVGFWLLVELIFYLSISMVPTAMAIAVLISAVMVMGNLAEHYELASFKSAGVPLWRIMMPLMFVAVGLSLFSFFCSNNLIPIANLQFKTRLYDIRKQKPTLSLEKGIFNYDFKGFVIRIGGKAEDNRGISDVLIYDHNNYNQEGATRILAEEGEMYTTDDKKFFVMNLSNGTQYQAVARKGQGGKKDSYPFIRTNFKEWSKVFDLQEFEINRTDERLFKTHQSMLTSSQLVVAVDSISKKIDKKYRDISNFMLQSQYPFKDLVVRPEQQKDRPQVNTGEGQGKKVKSSAAKRDSSGTSRPKDSPPSSSKASNNRPDSVKSARQRAAETIRQARADRAAGKKSPLDKTPAPATQPPVTPPPTAKTQNKTNKSPRTKQKMKGIPDQERKKQKAEKLAKEKKKVRGNQPMQQVLTRPLDQYDSWLATFPKKERLPLYSRAKSILRTITSQAESTERSLDRLRESRVKHQYSLHEKFGMAAVCFIFLFIGAPMGAIIRKGGFGYPILVSIFFFIAFIVMTIFCKKVAETFVIDAVLAAWLPNIILFPIGIILTWRAMNDSKIINIDKYTAFFTRLFRSKKTEVEAETETEAS